MQFFFVEYPPYWDEHDKDEGNLKLVLLDKDNSEEYDVIANNFSSTLKHNIIRIERIQNKLLWRKYVDCSKRMHEYNNGKVNPLKLFHGTRYNKPEAIYEGDASFDMRYSNNGLWGRGNYFAVNASYSHAYSHHCGGKIHQMLVALVLTGYSFYSPPNLRPQFQQPPVRGTVRGITVRHDSVSGHTGGSTVYITYDNDKAYPAYLVTYEV